MPGLIAGVPGRGTEVEMHELAASQEERANGDCFTGSQPEGHLLLVPAAWRRVPSREKLCCHGRAGEEMDMGAEGGLLLPGFREGGDPVLLCDTRSFCPSKSSARLCFFLSLTRDHLGASQQFSWDSSQPWPSQKLSASDRYRPRTTSGHLGGRLGTTHTFKGAATAVEPGSETWLRIVRAKPGEGSRGLGGPLACCPVGWQHSSGAGSSSGPSHSLSGAQGGGGWALLGEVKRQSS